MLILTKHKNLGNGYKIMATPLHGFHKVSSVYRLAKCILSVLLLGAQTKDYFKRRAVSHYYWMIYKLCIPILQSLPDEQWQQWCCCWWDTCDLVACRSCSGRGQRCWARIVVHSRGGCVDHVESASSAVVCDWILSSTLGLK